MIPNFNAVCFVRIAVRFRLNSAKMHKIFNLTWSAWANELHSHAQVLIQLDMKSIYSYITRSQFVGKAT